MTAKALSVSGVFAEIEYKPHFVQRRIHAEMERSRFRVVCAGRRTGKSTLGGHELTPRAYQAFLQRRHLNRNGARHEYWIIGPEYSDAEKEFRVLYNDLQKLEVPFDRPGTYNDPISGNMHISLWDGRFQVHAKSAKYPDTLVGEGLRGVILAEAAKLKPSVWTKYIRPTLADYRGWALLSSTPEGKNWFYDAYMRGQKNEDGWWSIRMPSWSNDILFPGGREDPEILAMEGEMAEEKFNQEIGAQFTEFVGRVFKSFDEETHVGHYPFDPTRRTYLATDYGFTNPNVLLVIQVDVWDNVYVVGEYYHRRKTPLEFANEVWTDPILGPMVRSAIQLFPDPEDPGTSTLLSNHWQVSVAGGTGGRILDRVDLIRRWLKVGPDFMDDNDPEKKPKLFFDFRCTESIREHNDYRYPETRGERNEAENPLKQDDHTPEALGRFFAGHFSRVVREAGSATVKKARSA